MKFWYHTPKLNEAKIVSCHNKYFYGIILDVFRRLEDWFDPWSFFRSTPKFLGYIFALRRSINGLLKIASMIVAHMGHIKSHCPEKKKWRRKATTKNKKLTKKIFIVSLDKIWCLDDIIGLFCRLIWQLRWNLAQRKCHWKLFLNYLAKVRDAEVLVCW